jgi:uridine kinase
MKVINNRFQTQTRRAMLDSPAPSATHSSPGDSVSLFTERSFSSPLGLPHIHTTAIAEAEVSTPEGRQSVANELLSRMEAYPAATAVIGVTKGEENQTQLIVASRPDALEADSLQGVYEVVARTASSHYIKNHVRAYPTYRQTVVPFDPEQKTDALRLPGNHQVEDVNFALSQGMEANNDSLYDRVVEQLPETGRAVILLAGPPRAGKSYQMNNNLLTRIHEKYPEREVLKIEGDNYFRDIDDPGYPFRAPDGEIRTQAELGTGADDSGLTRFWDHYDVMDHDLLMDNMTELVEKGQTEQPMFNFLGVKGSEAQWDAKFPFRGVREGSKKVELGDDGILVLDNIHAGNTEIVEHFQKLGVPFFTVFMDTPNVNDRLVRGIVRDADSRSLTASETLGAWDGTTRPGEKSFIYPGLKSLDPAKDIVYVSTFKSEPHVDRKTVEHKVDLIEKHGLQPAYHHFTLADEEFPAEARRAEAEYTQLLAETTDPAQVSKIQKRLERLQAAL